MVVIVNYRVSKECIRNSSDIGPKVHFSQFQVLYTLLRFVKSSTGGGWGAVALEALQ